MKKIVVLGGGYGGAVAALGLARQFPDKKEVSIILIDKHNYQLFNSNLFEVATAEEDFVSLEQLKKSITIPHVEMFDGENVELLQAEISEIDAAQKIVSAGGKKIAYDYLVVALGSVSDYFNIEGAEKYSLPLKSYTDALRIKNQLEFAIQAHRQDINKPNLRIVVAGGGYTGCEFAAELSHEVDILAWKNQYPPEKIEIVIVEATAQLIPGFSTRMSQDALWHLKNHGVRVQLSSPIAKVNEQFVEFGNGEQEAYDVLVWTTGVKARSLPFVQRPNLDKKGRVITNQFLQSDKDDHIFVIGDCACILNVDGKPAPPSAQDAIAQGDYIAYALPKLMANQRPQEYQGRKHGFIVTMGGKSAILNYGGFYFKGFAAFVVRQLANLRYYAKVVGWWQAFKYIVFQVDVFSRND